MTIYRIVPDSDTYHSLSIIDSEHVEIFRQFTGKSLAHSWFPVQVRIFRAKKSGDFPSLLSHVPIFSERALQILRPLISNSLEALPLKCDFGKFYAANILDVVDCLDDSLANIERFSSGRIMAIERYAFKEDCIEGKHIFKIPETALQDVLVSDNFKSLVEENGLLGLEFKQVD